jgi:hypothetical protein
MGALCLFHVFYRHTLKRDIGTGVGFSNFTNGCVDSVIFEQKSQVIEIIIKTTGVTE